MTESQGLGVLMLDVAGLELTGEDRYLLANPQVGGVILGLHGRNYASVDQLRDLVAAIRECNSRLLIAVDQEGGRVQRFQHEFTRLPPMHTFGALFEDDRSSAISLASTCGWLMAAEVLACGLDFSFAPVLDLYRQDSRIIADRAFAAEPATVVALATAFIRGMHDAGMKATGKHFPGHGSVVEDSHVELPVESRGLDELLEADLLPFLQCAPVLDAVMPGHVVYSQVDDCCAALSAVWLQDILRRRLNFKGVVFSDDLSMAAALSAGDVVTRSRLALEAGCDMILVCNDRGGARQVVDWLDANDHPANGSLPTMRGTIGQDFQALQTTDRWQAASDAIARLAASS